MSPIAFFLRNILSSLLAKRQPTSIISAVLFLLLFSVCVSAQTVIRGPYLQTATPNSIVVKWRTDVAMDSRVEYGLGYDSLTMSLSQGSMTTEHEVEITGLQPDTRYYYNIGTTTQVLAGDESHTFLTFPLPNTDRPVRLWVEGDSGKYAWTQNLVRDAYKIYTRPRPADVWLMLGDNAYTWGTDEEHQELLFDIYPEVLRQMALWPVIGNHELNDGVMGAYPDIFSLPTAGEAGGLASGTENYYSFDYGNIHFVALNSMEPDLTADGEMMTWLANDLAVNDKYWLIAYWHHLPFAEGGLGELLSAAMRLNALPLLESYGVDLVLTGHYHNYRRSKLVNGYYAYYPDSTPNSIILDGGDGQENGDGAYTKAGVGGTPSEGTIYVLNGSSSHTAASLPVGPMSVAKFGYIAMNVLGSVVIDVAGNRLDFIFLDDAAVVRDKFTLLKGPDTFPPALVIAQSGGADKVLGTFSEPVDAATASTVGNYSIAGLTVTAATLMADQRTVELDVSPLTIDTAYTLIATSVQDLVGNVIAGFNTQNFTAGTGLLGDADADLMPDTWEHGNGLNPDDPSDAILDADADQLDNLVEFQNGTDPNNEDTDADGLLDGEELNAHGTDPLNPDTDGDGMPDDWEVDNGLNPTDPSDASQDADGDQLDNLSEYENSANPNNSDTDGDGVGDNEDAFPTDPAETVDTDGDGIGDNSDPYPDNPYNDPNEACGEPVFDENLDLGTFLWEDCDGSGMWHLRVTGGGLPMWTSYDGVIESTGGLISLTEYRIEPSDILDTVSNPDELAYVLTAYNAGIDGFDFVPAVDACFIPGEPGLPVYLGDSRTELLTVDLQLDDLGVCTESSGCHP